MSRQIWATFLVQKGLQLLGCKTQSFQETRQQQLSTSTKSYNGRVRFQPIHAIEESAGHCRKLWRIANCVPYTDTNTNQQHG